MTRGGCSFGDLTMKKKQPQMTTMGGAQTGPNDPPHATSRAASMKDSIKKVASVGYQFHKRGYKHLPAIGMAFVTQGPAGAASVATTAGATQAADMYSEANPDSQLVRKGRQVAKTYRQKGTAQAVKHAGRQLARHVGGDHTADLADASTRAADVYQSHGATETIKHAGRQLAKDTSGHVSEHASEMGRRIRGHAKSKTVIPPAASSLSTSSLPSAATLAKISSVVAPALLAYKANQSTGTPNAIASAALAGLSGYNSASSAAVATA
jgi:hypothetical protein